MATGKRRTRDYVAEYLRRIALAQSRGLSRSVGRGHARAGERPLPTGLRLINPKRPEEQAIRLIKKGSSLRAAALAEGVTEERLRRYLKENTDAQYAGRKWEVADARPRKFPFYSHGTLVSPWLAPSEASEAANYMHAVSAFLPTGDDTLLAPYVGGRVTDVHGVPYVFETEPNTLYRLDSAGDLDFPEIYKIVAKGAP